MAALTLLPLHRCLADSLAPSFSDTVYPCLIWTSAEDLADPLPPYKSLHCMGSLHCVTLYIVVNICEGSCYLPLAVADNILVAPSPKVDLTGISCYWISAFKP